MYSSCVSLQVVREASERIFFTTWETVSVPKLLRVTYVMGEWSRNRVAVCVSVAFDVAIAHVSVRERSVARATKVLPFLDCSSWPSTSKGRKKPEKVPENSCRLSLRFILLSLRAHITHLLPGFMHMITRKRPEELFFYHIVHGSRTWGLSHWGIQLFMENALPKWYLHYVSKAAFISSMFGINVRYAQRGISIHWFRLAL